MIASGETIIGCQCARRSACRSPTSLLERRLASSDAGWGQVAGAVTAAATRGRTSWPGDTPGGDTLRVGGSVVLDAPFGRFLGDADFPHRRGIPRRVAKCGTRRRAHRHLRRADTRSAQGLGPRPGHLEIGHWQQIWTGANATSIAWHGARHVTVDNSATSRTSRHSRCTQPEQPARRRRQQRRRRAGRGASRRDRVLVSSRTMWSVTFAVPEHEGDHEE